MQQLAEMSKQIQALQAAVAGPSDTDSSEEGGDEEGDDEGDEDPADKTEDEAGVGGSSGSAAENSAGSGGGMSSSTPSSTNDSKAVLAEFQETVSLAEILAPGLKLPTHDAKASPKAVRDTLCVLRRRALAKAYTTDAGREVIEKLAGKGRPDFTKMTCDAASILFRGAAGAVREKNNPAPSFHEAS
jgi:hypothetical protein